jgi:hypothetical protein
MWEKTLLIAEALNEPADIASSLSNLGTAWNTLGDAKKSISFQ